MIGGPLDGQQAPEDWVREGYLVRGIVSVPYRLDLGNYPTCLVWDWCKTKLDPDRVVLYRLASRKKLIFEGYA